MFAVMIMTMLVSNGVSALPTADSTELPVKGRGFYYPYSYQNINWYNFPYLWPAVAGGLLDPTAPLAGVGTGCPTGFCPSGASCSQYLGQWQCGCGVGGCNGSEFYLNLARRASSFSLNFCCTFS